MTTFDDYFMIFVTTDNLVIPLLAVLVLAILIAILMKLVSDSKFDDIPDYDHLTDEQLIKKKQIEQLFGEEEYDNLSRKLGYNFGVGGNFNEREGEKEK